MCRVLFLVASLALLCAAVPKGKDFSDIRLLPSGWQLPDALPAHLTAPLHARAEMYIFDRLYDHLQSGDPEAAEYFELLGQEAYFFDHVTQKACEGRDAAVQCLHALMDTKSSSCKVNWCSASDHRMVMLNIARVEVARLTEYYQPS